MNSLINNEKITIEKDGKEVECEVLFTFDCEDTNKSYVGYTDQSIEENGRKTIYVSSYNPFSMKLELEDITDQKELEMIHEVLQRIDQEG